MCVQSSKILSMAKKILQLAVIITSIFISCTRNAITGRSPLKLLPESSLQSMAPTQCQEFLSSNKVIGNNSNKDAEMVARVGDKIRRVVENYYASKGLSKELEG